MTKIHIHIHTADSENLIFGNTWEQIQRAQQRGQLNELAKPGNPHSDVYKHYEADKKLLGEIGMDGLKEKQFFGVIDRINRWKAAGIK